MRTLNSRSMSTTSMAVSVAARCPGIRKSLSRAASRASCSMRPACAAGTWRPRNEHNNHGFRLTQHIPGATINSRSSPYKLLCHSSSSSSSSNGNGSDNGNSPPPASAAATNGSQQQQRQQEEAHSYEYDLVVIGGGSGGVRAARASAQLGAKVALVELPFAFLSSAEKGGVGGTCVLRGCVPKKLLLYASEFEREFEAAKSFGWRDAQPGTLHWPSFIEAKRKELHRLNTAYTDNLVKAGVEVVEGRGTVAGPHAVAVGDRQLSTRHIVIATGGQSSRIPIPGAEHCIISDKVLELEELPRKVTLIGGGYIGMEFAGMFQRLGCEVHVVARQALPLAPRFDAEVCKFAAEQYKATGLHLHMSANPTEVVKQPDGRLTVKISGLNGREDSCITDNDQVVLAVGRGAKTKGLGLEETGVELGPKASVKVDAFSRTNIPSIWAVGDVAGRLPLTPIAIMEGEALAQTLFGEAPVAPDYEAVPSAVFSWPFIGTVGLTEEQAVEKCTKGVRVYTKSFTPLKGSIEGSPLKTFIKVLVEEGSERVVGCHMVGEDAPEIIQGMAVAVKWGITFQQLTSVVGVHPTAAEEMVNLKNTPFRRVAKEGQDKQDEAAGKQDRQEQGKEQQQRASAAAA